MQAIRALTLFDEIPSGFIAHPITNDDSDPHLRAGEVAIVDTTDTEPQHGELYLVRWGSGRKSIERCSPGAMSLMANRSLVSGRAA
jgi:hypothetical protein